jgi:hypothetical protein
MAVKIGDVTIRIGATTAQLEADLRKAERAMQASAAKFTSLGQSMTLGVTVPVLAAGAAAFKMASDYEESLNKVRVSFGESSKSVEDFAKTTLTSFGIAEGSALEMAGLFGNMATSMGITQKDAAKLSTEMVGLAGDMASFNNVPLDQVQTALNSIFTGEAEPLKRFGINMLESSLAAFALEQGISKSVKSMTDAEKISLRYAFVLDRTKNAQGDFSRTNDSASNQMRIFQESTKQLAASFGQVLLPAITPIINGINKVLASMQGLSSETKTTIVVFAGIAAALGPALIVFAQIYKSVGLLQIAFVRIGVLLSGGGGIIAAMSAITGPIAIGIAALAAGIYLIYKNWDLVKASLVDVVNYFINLYNESIVVRVGVEAIILSFKTLFNIVKLGASIILNAFKSIFTFIINGFKNIGALIEAVFTGNFKAIPGIILDGFKNFGTLGDFVQDSLKDVKSFATINALDTSTAINNALRKNIKPLKQADVVDPFAKNIDFTITNKKKTEDDTPKIDPELAKELAKIATELANVDKLFKAGLITPVEQAEQKIKLLEDRLKLLAINGFKPNSKAILDTKNQIQGLKDGQERIIKPIQAFLQLINVIPGKLNPIAQQASELQLRFFELENAVKNGLITPFEASQQKIDLLNNELKRLSDEGLVPTSKEIQNVRDQLSKLGVVSFGNIENLSDPIAELSNEILTELSKQITIIQDKTKAGLISATDADVERVNAIKSALNNLIEQGLGDSDLAKKLQEQLKSVENTAKQSFTNIFDFLGNKIANLPGLAEKLGENVQTLGPKIGKAFEGAVAAVQQVFSTFGAFFDLQEAKIDQFEQKEKERIETSISNEEAKEAALERLNETVLKKRKALARKQAAIDKAAALFSATIAGANAVLQALAVPLIGPVLAKITAGLVAAQLAFIAAAPLPSLAIGTSMVKSDGLAMIHKGEAIVPADVAKGGFNGSGGIANVVGRIQGTDIILASDYSMNFKNRIR